MSKDAPTADDLADAHGDGQEKAIGWLAVGITGDENSFRGASPEKVCAGIEAVTDEGPPIIVKARRDGFGSALCDVARGVAGGTLARFLRKEDLAGQPHPSSWPSEVVNPAGFSSEQVTAALATAAERLFALEGQRVEGPLIEVRLIGALLPSQERWGHAAEEEPETFTGDFATRDEAVDDGRSTYEGDFYVVKGRAPRAAELVSKGVADEIFERMIEAVGDNHGSDTGDAFAAEEPSQAAMDELVALIKAWANRHIKIGFWAGTGKVERIENGGNGVQQDG